LSVSGFLAGWPAGGFWAKASEGSPPTNAPENAKRTAPERSADVQSDETRTDLERIPCLLQRWLVTPR
jgi:hypothetical protein